MNLDYYELIYNYKNFAATNSENDIWISEYKKITLLEYITNKVNAAANKDILLEKIIKEINFSVNNEYKQDFIFSDAEYIKVAVFKENQNGTRNIIDFIYEPKILNKNVTINPSDAIKKYNDFDINNLPLIEIAQFLNITVTKLKSNENYGSFSSKNMTITLRTDLPCVYLHELSHAIDYLLGQNDNTDKNSNEVVAELSTLYLCKKYNIQNNDENSIAYINSYKGNITLSKNDEIITRVKNIYYFIMECKSEIERHGA
ncbi:hypothetical protein AGMMS50230_11300 [Spirochaetia bacterium]|nr:hypothetical protein AGMMS50230_11300 [Spirochaetia bacterium]